MNGARPSDPATALGGLPLSPLERRLCQVLSLHFGRFVPNERLISAAYDDHRDGGPDNPQRVIDVTFSRLKPTLAGAGLRIESASGSRRLVADSRPAVTAVAAASSVENAESKPAEPPPLAPNHFLLGEAEGGGGVSIDLGKLLVGRLLIQGSSGAGKSWTLRRLLEQTVRDIQQIVVDPEGDFRTLAEAYGHVVVDAHTLDVAAVAKAATLARQHRISMVLDLSQVDRGGQLAIATALFTALIESARENWHPAIVAIDEAHLFAPFGGDSSSYPALRKASIAAVVDLMSRGRKRGLAGVLSTQRLARLSKSVVSEASNFLVGGNTLDLDIRRAAETIGWDASRAFDRLPLLTPGDFVAVGPAFSRSPAVLRVGGVTSSHRGDAPAISAPKPIATETAAQLLDLDALAAASGADAEQRAAATWPPGFRAVRDFIRDPGFRLAGQIVADLAALAPDGTLLEDLIGATPAPLDAVLSALALLDRYAALEYSGSDADRAVRLAPGVLS